MLSHPLLNAISHAIGFLHNGPLVHSFGRSPSRQMASANQLSLFVIVYLSSCLLVSLVFQSLVLVVLLGLFTELVLRTLKHFEELRCLRFVSCRFRCNQGAMLKYLLQGFFVTIL